MAKPQLVWPGPLKGHASGVPHGAAPESGLLAAEGDPSGPKGRVGLGHACGAAESRTLSKTVYTYCGFALARVLNGEAQGDTTGLMTSVVPGRFR